MCDLDRVQVRIIGTGELEWHSLDDLAPYEDHAQAATIRDVSASNPEKEATAAQWTQLLQALPPEGNAPRDALEAIAQKMRVSVRTVQRRWVRFANNSLPAAQLSLVPGPQPGARHLGAQREGIVDLAIKEIYLTREKRSFKATAQRVSELCHAAGVKAPCYVTVKNRAERMDPMERAKRRLGADVAHAIQAPSGPGLTATRALEFVQIDHAIVDLIVVSPLHRKPVGRPWLTVAIDLKTRCILGYELSFAPPTQTSVGLCMDHACSPKKDWLRELNVECGYPIYGKMENVIWDNASTFKARNVMAQCARYGIHPKPRPVRQPHYGAFIERYIGTFMGAMHFLPGTTFSNPKSRGNYDSEKRAEMSLLDLQRWVALQIAGVYHNTPHSGLGGRTPLMAWKDAWIRPDGTQRIPELIGDRREFRLGFMPSVFRSITREGIGLHTLNYWDPALVPFINDGVRHQVHFDHRNLKTIFLRLGNDFIDIPLQDRTRAPFSLYELNEVKRARRAVTDMTSSEADIFDAMRKQRVIQDEAAVTSKEARRKQMRRPPAETRLVSTSTPVDYSSWPVPMDPAWGTVE